MRGGSSIALASPKVPYIVGGNAARDDAEAPQRIGTLPARVSCPDPGKHTPATVDVLRSVPSPKWE